MDSLCEDGSTKNQMNYIGMYIGARDGSVQQGRAFNQKTLVQTLNKYSLVLLNAREHAEQRDDLRLRLGIHCKLDYYLTFLLTEVLPPLFFFLRMLWSIRHAHHQKWTFLSSLHLPPFVAACTFLKENQLCNPSRQWS